MWACFSAETHEREWEITLCKWKKFREEWKSRRAWLPPLQLALWPGAVLLGSYLWVLFPMTRTREGSGDQAGVDPHCSPMVYEGGDVATFWAMRTEQIGVNVCVYPWSLERIRFEAAPCYFLWFREFRMPRWFCSTCEAIVLSNFTIGYEGLAVVLLLDCRIA